jgi:hypothetical protein
MTVEKRRPTGWQSESGRRGIANAVPAQRAGVYKFQQRVSAFRLGSQLKMLSARVPKK